LTDEITPRKKARGRRFNLSEVREQIALAIHATRFDMIVRMNGGQHIQVINTWDAEERITKFRARKVDSHGRSQSEFSSWFDSYNEATTAALELEAKGPFVKNAQDLPDNK
jgi:hypothetical protein